MTSPLKVDFVDHIDPWNASRANETNTRINSNSAAITSVPQSLDNLPVVTVATTGAAPIVSKTDYLTGTIAVGNTAAVSTSIRGRGNTTWMRPKKPYRIKLDTAASLLGMPSSKHWALLANYMDPSMIRNTVTFHIGQLCSGLAWTPHLKPVDVVLNGTYQGHYVLSEIVKAEPARVSVSVSNAGTGLALTGAYLLEIDNAYYGDNPNWFVTSHDGLHIILDDPDGTNGTYGAAQVTYITAWINNFETILYGEDWLDPTTGYAPLIDRNSFIDWYLVNELVAGEDSAFATSCKCYKTHDATGVPGKLYMGPLWDYDLCLGRALGTEYSAEHWWVRDTVQPNGDGPVPGATWILRMFDDPGFAAAVVARWPQIVTAIGDINAFVDNAAATIALAYHRDADVWDESETGRNAAPWRLEVDYMKTWLTDRISWITDNLADSLDVSAPDTTAPTVPTGLASSAVSDTGFTLSWTASTDAVGVTGYEVRLDGGTAVSDPASPHLFTGLTASTDYDAPVRATDASGNWSAWSSILTVTTSSGDSTVPDPTSDFDFHEGSGTTAASLVGGYTMSCFGDVWTTGGINGAATGYIGPDESITDFSILFEVTITSDGTFGSIGSDPWFNMSGGFYPGPWSPNQFGTVPIPTGVSSKVVYTFNSSSCAVYVDGELSGTFANSHPINPGTEYAALFPDGFRATGVFHRVTFWDVELSSDQVAELSSGGGSFALFSFPHEFPDQQGRADA